MSVTLNNPAAGFPGQVSGAGNSAWVAGTQYVPGNAVLGPWGGAAICRTAHTALSWFDARKWIIPSDDGATVFDFRQLPDGPLNSVRPTRGTIDAFGVADANWIQYRVKNGAMRWNDEQAGRDNLYLQGELAEGGLSVQHAWLVFECATVAEQGQSLLILLPGPLKWGSGTDANRAYVHWHMFGNISGAQTGVMQMYGYNSSGVANGPVYNTAVPLSGREIRWDCVVNRKTGNLRAFLNGLLVGEYTSTAAIAFMSQFGMFEMNGPTFAVREFGLSPAIPAWAIQGNARQVSIAGSTYLPVETLTTTWQKLRDITVAYGDSGLVEVEWSPFLNCGAGYIQMDLSTTAAVPSQAYPMRMCNAGTDARVPFRSVRSGTPGTTETIAIWAKVSDVTVASYIRADNYGAQLGPRWYQVQQDPKLV